MVLRIFEAEQKKSTVTKNTFPFENFNDKNAACQDELDNNPLRYFLLSQEI